MYSVIVIFILKNTKGIFVYTYR